MKVNTWVATDNEHLAEIVLRKRGAWSELVNKALVEHFKDGVPSEYAAKSKPRPVKPTRVEESKNA